VATPLRVLMVEDSEDDAVLVLRQLRRSENEPTFERVDTPEAMKAALDRQTWDIVISDYSMPRFSMPAALRMVQEKGIDVPFIVVSGAIGEEAAVEAMRAGAHDYVMKDNLARLAPVVEREVREAELRHAHRRVEGEKRRIEQQLQLAGRLAAVGELAAGIAHELNNPLTAVQGFAELLLARDDMHESIRDDVESIYGQAQRAAKITANLLSFSRKHCPERTLISVNEAVQQSLDLHAYRLRVNNIELSTELHPGLPWIMADFHQLQQVFVNIVVNAEHAMLDAHGRGRLRVRTEQAGEVIRVLLADDGPGVSEDNLKRVFDPFFTTKKVGEGTGLGLSICYGIVEQHGGHIYADSEPGKGARFVVELPVVSDAHAKEEAEYT